MTMTNSMLYHEGAYAAISEILYMIDNLITESSYYKENDKLWKLRDKVSILLTIAEANINQTK